MHLLEFLNIYETVYYFCDAQLKRAIEYEESTKLYQVFKF